MSNPLSTEMLRAQFEKGLPYDQYVGTGKPNERENWETFHAKVSLTAGQRALVAGFSRRVNVLCLSGSWCGDCVQQVPFIDAIRGANPEQVHARYLEREAHKEFSDQVKVCGGNRVPVTIFMNEDFEFVSFFGDRTLNRYRAIAARQLGAACPLPGAEAHSADIATQLQDWVDEFERVHLLLRLSNKLRQRHGD